MPTRQVVFADCGHSPNIEKSKEFAAALVEFLQAGK